MAFPNRSDHVMATHMSAAATDKLTVGRLAEDSACQYLAKNGLKLITRNYKCRRGEIDLVMRHNDSIVFIEVRYRHNNHFGSGAESVINKKQKKIILTALHYLQSHKEAAGLSCRFDVIAVQPGPDKNHIQWIQDAFQA